MAEVNDRLIVELSANISKFEASMNRAVAISAASASRITTHAKTIESAFAKVGSGNVGAAIDKVFNASRLKVLDEGASKLGVFGSGLEALGGYGLAAAAGLAAVGVAAEGALKFTEFAADLERASKALGLTTTQVQEFDHVATALNIPVEKLRDSLGGLEAQLGNLESGLIRGKQLQEFTKAIGIGPEQLRSWGTLEQQLPHVLDALAKLNTEERIGAAKRLRIDPEVLNSLIDGRNRITDLIAEAHRYGLVVDADVIRKGAEASEQLKTAGDIIRTNLTVAFADLAPVIVSVANALAQATRYLNDFIQGFKPIEERNRTALQDRLKQLQAINIELIKGAGGPLAAMKQEELPGSRISENLREQREIEEKLGVMALATEPTPPGAPPTQIVAPTEKARRARKERDDTDELMKEADDKLYGARKAEADAAAQLTDNILARRDFELDAAATEFDRQQADIDAQEKKIAADKGITEATKAALKATLEQARMADENANTSRQVKIARDAAFKLEDQRVADDQAAANATLAELRLQEKLATTKAQRDRIQRDILALEQQIETETKTTQLARDLATGKISQAEYDARVAQLGREQGAARGELAAGQAGPFARYAAQHADLATELQDNAVKAMETLNSGLAEAIVNGKGLHQTLSNLLKQFEADLLKSALGAGESSLLGALGLGGGGGGAAGAAAGTPGAGTFATASAAFMSIFKFFGFASGTASAPGGLAVVGERGPELVGLPRGASVLPNSTLTNLANVGALNRGGGSISVNLTSSYDMRGAAGDETISRMLSVAHTRTVSEVLDALPRVVPGIVAQHTLEAG